MSEALGRIDFGVGAAQQERHLRNYFFRSGSFELAASQRITLVLGPKGAGKSAIFRMFQEIELPLFQAPNLCVFEEPQLREYVAACRAVGVEASEVVLWRLCIASLVAGVAAECEDAPAEVVQQCQRFLARWGLVREIPTAWQNLRRMKVSVGFGQYLKAEFPPATPVSIAEIDVVLHAVNSWLRGEDRDCWICMDSLDEVSLNGPGSPVALLSALMRAVGEIIRLQHIRFKLFFRTDLYSSLTYVNKDHFSGTKVELRWVREDLAILLGHRLSVLYPEHDGAIQYPLARTWIDAVFDWSGGVASFDALVQQLTDGNGYVLPRDLVKFCIEAQSAQQTFNVQGVNATGGLIGTEAIEAGLRRTAESKLTDFLQVFEDYVRYFERLRGHRRTSFARKELLESLGTPSSPDAQLLIAELVRIGALGVSDKKAVGQSDAFYVPPLYAAALNLGGDDV